MEGLGIFGDLPQLDPLPAVGSNHDNASHTHDDRVNIFGDLPQLDPLPAVGSNHAQALQIRDDRLDIFGDLPQLDPLPAVGSNHAQALQIRDDRLDIFGPNQLFGDLPQLDPLPAGGSSHAQALQTRDDRFDIFGDLPQLDPLPAVKNCSSTALLPAVGGKKQKLAVGGKHAVIIFGGLFGGLPSLPPFSCSCSDSSHLEPAVGGKTRGKSKRKHKVLVEQARRLASKSIPWRSLPYLREAALADIRVVAKHYGDDLLDISPGESFLNLREARELLESNPASRWRHCLNKQGELKPAALDNSVDFLEIFSGCGHLTLGAARQGLQVGPSIDKRTGIGHDNAFSIDIKKASDRKLVWALVMVLCPRWIHCGFPCTFWVGMAHWTRIRDLDTNEVDRMESLLYITFSRQLVYYQASRWRHSSIENPQGSLAWSLDIVQDMIKASKMSYVDMDLCAWGAIDPCSGKFYHKTMRLACTFNVESLMRRCPKDHEHEIVQGKLKGSPFKGRTRSAISGQYPLPLCDAWASLAKRLISPS